MKSLLLPAKASFVLSGSLAAVLVAGTGLGASATAEGFFNGGFIIEVIFASFHAINFKLAYAVREGAIQ